MKGILRIRESHRYIESFELERVNGYIESFELERAIGYIESFELERGRYRESFE